MTQSGVPPDRGEAFGAWADAYDRWRPKYPQSFVERILGPDPGTVVDIGAGTGILTQLIADMGHRVVAIEPDARMRAVLDTRLGPGSALAGSAEQTNLPDGAAATVIGAQMWHWVDPTRAVPEIARILRPGGRLIIVWLLRDDSVGWVDHMCRNMSLPDAASNFDPTMVPPLPAPFGEFHMTRESFDQEIPRRHLTDHLRTYSTVALAPDVDDQVARAQAIIDADPATAGRDTVMMPFVAIALTALRN